MDFSNNELKAEYNRWVDKLSEENDRFNDCTVTILDVLNAHFSIVDYFLEEGEEEKAVGGIGPRDEGLLSSAIARQVTSYGNNEKWKTDYEKCATLYYGLIKNHPFHDCNKRTALLIALYYLSKINRTFKVKQKELEILTLRVAMNGLNEYKRYKKFSKTDDGEIYFLSMYFQRITRTFNKRYYVITYHQLNSLLDRFGFKLDNPHKNYIDVIKIEKKKSLFGLRKEKINEIRIGRMNFPGWTREICQRDMNFVRDMTKLTPKNGFDSEVFYKGAEPLKSLINEFSSPLKRLAKK